MALLNRFSKLNDRNETGIFTFIVTPSVTRDLHRDATTKDFCFGYHRWAVSFQRPTDKLLGVHLLLRNASPGTACVVDFTLTLLNREHFSQNQVYTKKQAKFSITNPMQGVSRWIELSELVERRFSNESGEFLFELSLSNMTTIFECDVQLSAQVLGQYKQLLKSGGQATSGNRAAAGGEQAPPGHKTKASKNLAAGASAASAEQPINLDTNQFTFGSFDWSLTIVPLVMPGAESASGLNVQQQPAEPVCRIYLNRLSGFDSLCRVKYRVILGHHQPGGAQSAEWVDSKQLDQISDCDGRIRGFQFRSTNILKLVSLRHNAAGSQASLQQQQPNHQVHAHHHHHTGARHQHGHAHSIPGGQQAGQGAAATGSSLDLRVHIEMFCANTISEARVPLERKADEPQLANCSDRNKQAWCVEADRDSADSLKLKLFFLDLQSVPRNHIRYISWIAYLVRRDPKSGQMRDSLAVRNAPHSNYYLQDGIDMGSIMDTELSVKELNKSQKSYLDSGQLTVHIEWVDSLLLFSHLYNNYDALAMVQRHQISRELEALQQEFDHLEGKYLQTQRSLSRLASGAGAGQPSDREQARQSDHRPDLAHQRKHVNKEAADTTSDCSDTSDSETRRARRVQRLQNGRSSSNSNQLQLNQKQQQHSLKGGLLADRSGAAAKRQQHLDHIPLTGAEVEPRSSSSLSLGDQLSGRLQLATRPGSMRAHSPISSIQGVEWLRRSSAASSNDDAHSREQSQVLTQADSLTRGTSSTTPVVRRRLPQPKVNSTVASIAATSGLDCPRFRHLAVSFDQQQQQQQQQQKLRQLSTGYNYHQAGQDEQQWPAGMAMNGNDKSDTGSLSPLSTAERVCGSLDKQLDERATRKLDRLQMILHTSQRERTLDSHRYQETSATSAFPAGRTSISGPFPAASAPRAVGSELEAGETPGAFERGEADKNFHQAHVMGAARDDRLLVEQSAVQLDHQERQHARLYQAGHHQDQQFASTTRDPFALRNSQPASLDSYSSAPIGYYAPSTETAPVYMVQASDKTIDDIPLEFLATKRNGATLDGSFHGGADAFAISAIEPSGELDSSIASHYLERARSIRLSPSVFVPSGSPINLSRSAIDQIHQQRRQSPSNIKTEWSHLTGSEGREVRVSNEQAREQERRRLSELGIGDNPITGLDEELANIELEARLKYL